MRGMTIFNPQKCLGQVGRINSERKDWKQLDEYTYKNKLWLRKNRAVAHSGDASRKENNRSEPIRPKYVPFIHSLLSSQGDWCSTKQLVAFLEAEKKFCYPNYGNCRR